MGRKTPIPTYIGYKPKPTAWVYILIAVGILFALYYFRNDIKRAIYGNKEN